MTKLMTKNKKAWTITENPKYNDFVNKEEIVTAKKRDYNGVLTKWE